MINWLRSIARKLRKKFQYWRFRLTAHEYDVESLKRDFLKMGFKKGDIVFTHSSLKSLGFVKGGAETVIRAMMEVVGEEGTLAFPVYTVPQSMLATLSDPEYVFDPEKGNATTGKIPDTFWRMKGVKRSLHATHSVAAWGRLADEIVSDHYKNPYAFGTGSPFERLWRHNAKILGLGAGFHVVAYYHVFEDHNLGLFPGVYHKTLFHPKIKTPAGIVVAEQWAHDPAYSKKRIDRNPDIEQYFHQHMKSTGKLTTGAIGDSYSWTMTTTDFMDELMKLRQADKTIYSI